MLTLQDVMEEAPKAGHARAGSLSLSPGVRSVPVFLYPARSLADPALAGLRSLPQLVPGLGIAQQGMEEGRVGNCAEALVPAGYYAGLTSPQRAWLDRLVLALARFASEEGACPAPDWDTGPDFGDDVRVGMHVQLSLVPALQARPVAEAGEEAGLWEEDDEDDPVLARLAQRGAGIAGPAGLDPEDGAGEEQGDE